MAMNEEQKKAAAAERMRKARAAKKAAEEAAKSVEETAIDEQAKVAETACAQKMFSEDDVQRMIAEALAKQAESAKPQVIQVMQGEKRITVRFQAEVADDNVSYFGANNRYGPITGKMGMLYIPYSDWPQFLDERVRWMLKNRWLVVLDGLDEQERELNGINYRAGEVMDEKAFSKLLDMTEEELLEIFPKLCVPYREMVARRFVTGYQNGDHRVKERRGLVKKLNDISKKDYTDVPEGDIRRRGAFASIIDGMNQDDV